MKDIWYADNRDLVKWGVLLQLADHYQAVRILQVAYHRPNPWQPLEIDGREYSMPPAVIRHFRCLQDISRLSGAGPRPASGRAVAIEILDSPFVNRAEYLTEILAAVDASSGPPCIVFLDPDTGLESSKPGLEHVLGSELAGIWDHMRPGDVLVLYQHQNRSVSPWVPSKRVQFERGIGIADGTAKIARGKAAPDVVFFFVQKDGNAAPPRRPEPSTAKPTDQESNVDTQHSRWCPACHQKLFVRWPWGWDGHAAHGCPRDCRKHSRGAQAGIPGAIPEIVQIER